VALAVLAVPGLDAQPALFSAALVAKDGKVLGGVAAVVAQTVPLPVPDRMAAVLAVFPLQTLPQQIPVQVVAVAAAAPATALPRNSTRRVKSCAARTVACADVGVSVMQRSP
jgi:hypothetical protein